MIEVIGLVKCHGDRRVLDGVSLRVERGEIAVVIGPSGGGKSTLLRCINGLEPHDAGRVLVDGVCHRPAGSAAPEERRMRELRRRVGMVFQQFNLFPHLSALENVMAGPLWALGTPREDAVAAARRLLVRVGLGDRLDAQPETLSGGEQQRVAIARALAMAPEAILFDEPTSALDPRMASEVMEVIAGLAAAGQTMVIVTHAMGFARAVARMVHVMDAGRIVESGAPERVFTEPREETTREFLRQTRLL